MKRIVFVVLALIIAGCASTSPHRSELAGPLRITDSVWGWYQEYLGIIGYAHPGAFAVSIDGEWSYSVRCRTVMCVGGPTYKQEAIAGCEQTSGMECVVFAFGREILVAYEIEKAPVTPAAASSSDSTATVAPEEPPFESPLPDGTIVLSHKVAAMLDSYLNTPAVRTRQKRGYFFVSEDGRSAGSYICPGKCLDHMGGSWAVDAPDMTFRMVRDRAAAICNAGAAAPCTLLFADLDGKRSYRVTDTPVPQPIPVSAESTASAEPEEPPFESPLADGTIVLSHKVSAMLDVYLNTPAVRNHLKRAYFFVSEDGRSGGSYVCPGVCLDHMGGSWAVDAPDMTFQMVRDRAEAQCNAGAQTPCILLYKDLDEKRAFKPLGS